MGENDHLEEQAMSRHDVQALGTAGGGRHKLRRRITVAALLVGLGAASSVIQPPANAFEKLAGSESGQHVTP
ncbi:hypothetical protein ACGFNU_02240 [Spirillospora sp. NPDC048911]|uniref:hypothetical protein n=1 Tax=Spirillospora sp. NPDC048911 TaxID=3364527 RepID=UPI0037116E6C